MSEVFDGSAFGASLMRERLATSSAKLRAGVFNAIAIGAFVGAMIGPSLNPTLSGELTVGERLGLVFTAAIAHLLACLLVRDMEDKP